MAAFVLELGKRQGYHSKHHANLRVSRRGLGFRAAGGSSYPTDLGPYYVGDPKKTVILTAYRILVTPGNCRN